MGSFSHISWCDHTMNFWIGCTKVSEGCKFCYAEVDTFARRERSHGNELWGPTASRHRTSSALWKLPYAWNKKSEWLECRDCGWRGHLSAMNYITGAYRCPSCEGISTHPTRQRVFCQSLSDICEDHLQVTFEMRREISTIVMDCKNIDFLFLTKRPENFNRLWLEHFAGSLPDNLWVGTSVENQKAADARIGEIANIKAKVLFLSCEPLLGHIDFNASPELRDAFGKINWVIVGGESGIHARPMNPIWATSIRNQCEEADIPFHFKQWGEWNTDGANQNKPVIFTKDMDIPMFKVGKKNAGRELDGKEYNGFPEVS